MTINSVLDHNRWWADMTVVHGVVHARLCRTVSDPMSLYKSFCRTAQMGSTVGAGGFTLWSRHCPNGGCHRLAAKQGRVDGQREPAVQKVNKTCSTPINTDYFTVGKLRIIHGPGHLAWVTCMSTKNCTTPYSDQQCTERCSTVTTVSRLPPTDG